MSEEGKLQNFLADLQRFINCKQLTIIEEEKEADNRLSWQLFIRAFYLLKRKGERCDTQIRGSKRPHCFWLTPIYKIGSNFAFELDLSTPKYKDIPKKIRRLPKGIEGQKDFKIILCLVGENETLDNQKKIILTDESTDVYKRIDHKLVKIPLDDKQKKGLLQVLSFIRKKIKTLGVINKRIIEMYKPKK